MAAADSSSDPRPGLMPAEAQASAWHLAGHYAPAPDEDFGGTLTSAFTAHPKLCPETGGFHGSWIPDPL
ncbi:MAG TPA: hypothetical protein VLL75_10355 [Vicinamibacteria bacterium]|nr:hypothetical protein [Vicinamibacteria bacterium]